MALRPPDRLNFEHLKRAFAQGQAALMESRDKVTGEYRALVCGIGRAMNGDYLPAPYAVMVWGNPFEQFEDPTQDTLPPATEPQDARQVIADLVEWSARMGDWDAVCWERAKAYLAVTAR